MIKYAYIFLIIYYTINLVETILLYVQDNSKRREFWESYIPLMVLGLVPSFINLVYFNTLHNSSYLIMIWCTFIYNMLILCGTIYLVLKRRCDFTNILWNGMILVLNGLPIFL